MRGSTHRPIPTLALLAGLFAAAAIPLPAASSSFAIYFMDWDGVGSDGSLKRASFDASRVETLYDGMFNPFSVALHGDRVYWGSDNTIRSAALDGSDVQVVAGGLSSPFALEIDPVDERIYWSTIGSIRSMRLDGSDRKTIVGGLQWPFFLALDVAERRVYWTDFVANEVGRARLDGSARETLLLNVVDARGIDVYRGRLYIADPALSRQQIVSMNPDGSDQRVIAEGEQAFNVTVDPRTQAVYWSSPCFLDCVLKRSRLDGSGVESLLDMPDGPRGIAVIPSREVPLPDERDLFDSI